MPEFCGKWYTRSELMKRVGDITQIGGVRAYTLSDGKAKGVEVVQFRTGTGLLFEVLPGRGMDISYAEYCGKALGWISPTGVVAPELYEPEGLSWLRGFFGGLLTTCGVTTAGAPSEDAGESLGLHGRISNIRAQEVGHWGEWEGDDYVMRARGRVRQSVVFGENIVLDRTVTAKLGESRFFLEDRITNEGFDEAPFMILYHINAGFPSIDGGARLVSPTLSARPRDAAAEVEADKYMEVLPPTHGFAERCYYHEMACAQDGTVVAAVVNPSCGDGGFGFYVRYNKRELPKFTEWKMCGEGNYTVGLEPANCWVEGRAKERERGTLQTIRPGETRTVRMEFGVLDGADALRAVEEEVARLREAVR